MNTEKLTKLFRQNQDALKRIDSEINEMRLNFADSSEKSRILTHTLGAKLMLSESEIGHIINTLERIEGLNDVVLLGDFVRILQTIADSAPLNPTAISVSMGSATKTQISASERADTARWVREVADKTGIKLKSDVS